MCRLVCPKRLLATVWLDLGVLLMYVNPYHMTRKWQPDWLLPKVRGVW